VKELVEGEDARPETRSFQQEDECPERVDEASGQQGLDRPSWIALRHHDQYRQAEEALDSVGITLNRNAIPFDVRPPQITSGVRIGTPAVTTRGFGPDEMRTVAQLIVKVLNNLDDSRIYQEVRSAVTDLSRRFPVPGLG